MKRLTLLPALLCFVAVTAWAQQQVTKPQTSAVVGDAPLEEGNWLVGAGTGTTGYNFSTKTFQLDVKPRIGYFIRDNIAIGAGVTLGVKSQQDISSFEYGIAPFVRYYFDQVNASTGRFFGEAKLGISGSSSKTRQQDTHQEKPVSLLMGVSAGYAHFITRTVALEGILGYTYSKANISGGAGTSGLNVGFGFHIYLPGR